MNLDNLVLTAILTKLDLGIPQEWRWMRTEGYCMQFLITLNLQVRLDSQIRGKCMLSNQRTRIILLIDLLDIQMLVAHLILATRHPPNGGDPSLFQFAARSERPLGLDL